MNRRAKWCVDPEVTGRVHGRTHARGVLGWACALVFAVGCDGATAIAAPDDPVTANAEAVAAPTPALGLAMPPGPEPTPTPTLTPSVPEPVVADAPVEEPKRSGHADLDPINDLQPGPPAPLPDCEERLRAAGVTFKPARIGTSREVDGIPRCGAEQVVRYKRGPGKITYSSSPLLTCGMALALADFERIVQEEAEQRLGSRVVRIDHLGTFNCRKMALYDLVSEHSYANALDVQRMKLANGREVDVLAHFQPTKADPPEARSAFWRAIANRAFDEEVFSVVVTPYFDRAHRNHLHLDLARYRVDGSRP